MHRKPRTLIVSSAIMSAALLALSCPVLAGAGTGGDRAAQDEQSEQQSGTQQAQTEDALITTYDEVKLRQALIDEIDALLARLRTNIVDFRRDNWSTIQSKMDAIARDSSSLMDIVRANATPSLAPIVLNYPWFVVESMPRLTGAVLHVGKGKQYPDITQALLASKPGDVILLGEGEHIADESQLRSRRTWQDIAIIGRGPGLTTFGIMLWSSNRVLIDGVRWNSQGGYTTDIRESGQLYLRDCVVENYNSGSGSGSGLNIDDAMLLLERCEFNGLLGHASPDGKRDMLGNAMDLNGDCLLFARHCRFIDNDEVLRAYFPCVFDGCTSMSRMRQDFGVSQRSGSSLYIRENRVRLKRPTGTTFTHATDDPEFINHLINGDPIDKRSQQIAEALDLNNNVPYWLGLLRHDRPETRSIAAEQLTRLLNRKVDLPVAEGDEFQAGFDRWLATEVLATQLLEQWERDIAQRDNDEGDADNATGRGGA